MPKRKLNNVTQRKDGLWQARKVFGYKDDGSPNRKTFYGKTAQEAADKLSEYEKQVENGLNADVQNITFASWLNIWLKEYKLQNLSPRTYDSYENFIMGRISPALGKHKLLKLRPDHLQTFINNSKKDNGDVLSASSLKHLKVILSSSLEQAVKNGLIARNPANAISMPKSSTKKDVKAFTKEEQQLLLKELEGHRFYALFVLALGTGMRIGEILALKWSDVDFSLSEIKVHASISRSKDRNEKGEAEGSSRKTVQTKTKAGNRIVPLTDEVKSALLAHKEIQNAEYLKARSAWENNDLVFCTQLGGCNECRVITRLYSKRT